MMGRAWEIVCLFGLWGWVLATVGFILKSFPSRGSFRVRAALSWGLLLIGCFALWLAGMAHA